jgi:hypothetical protein
MRGFSIPSDIDRCYAHCVVYGIRHHDAFARSESIEILCSTSPKKDFARPRNARLIMSNEVPEMPTDNVRPYCIWYPDIASENTYRQVAKLCPEMRYTVGRACAVAGYDKLYHELDLLPEASIAVRSSLDMRRGIQTNGRYEADDRSEHYFDICEDHKIAETSPEEYVDITALAPDHEELLYTPILSHLPAINKDPLILMAAYEALTATSVYAGLGC